MQWLDRLIFFAVGVIAGTFIVMNVYAWNDDRTYTLQQNKLRAAQQELQIEQERAKIIQLQGHPCSVTKTQNAP
ncbi:MAG: hypothetical protein IJ934_03145 [Acetobacter sp.]|nr:hypothetical protein [Acetobacter sp.]